MITSRRFWTFNTLLGAFLDLFVAYFLLCGATIAFFAAKFLSFFGFFEGIIIPNSDFTNLLFHHPTDKISDVQFAVARNFPFDSIFCKVQNDGFDHLDGDIDDGFIGELEGEASCSSKSDARKIVRNENDFEKEKGGFDMKGKGAVNNYRVRGGSIRRRRKASLDSGKQQLQQNYSVSASSSPNWVTCLEDQTKEPNSQFEDEAETPMAVKSDDLTIESGNNPNGMKERVAIDEGDNDTRIISLTQELEEERAARSALYVELDEERNAAATAADEAMAMILRLQEEKASIEMELRQYKRMIDEKSAYDAEEMNIMKEILLRREREKHFLEKEVEAYRQMAGLENDQLDFNEEDPDMILQDLRMAVAANRRNSGNEDVELLKPEEDTERTIAIVGEVDAAFNKQLAEPESHVYDVHVIDNEPKSSDESKGGGGKKQRSTTDESFARRLEKEAGEVSSRSGSEAVAIGRLPPMSGNNNNSARRNSISLLDSARRNSASVLDSERIRIDTEVGLLRERLRIVQEGREKLNVSIDNGQKESLQLQLLEDIARQLQEIRMLTEPRTSRQGSLPISSSKSSTKKRRCRSASTGPAKSS